jgi:hypothetical protein
VVGAAVGSNTIGQFIQKSSPAWKAVDDYLGGLVPQIAASLASTADDWIKAKQGLKDSLVSSFLKNKKPDPNKNNDKDFQDWYDSVAGGREMRRIVWELFVLPVPGLEFDKGQQGMKRFLVTKLTDLKNKYNAQYKAYWIEASQRYLDYASSFRNAFSTKSFAQWMILYYPSFHFTISLGGLPAEFLKVQDKRLLEFEWKLTCGCGHKISVPGAGFAQHS